MRLLLIGLLILLILICVKKLGTSVSNPTDEEMNEDLPICPICFECLPMDGRTTHWKCNNCHRGFHHQCISRIDNNRCPTCRAEPLNGYNGGPLNPIESPPSVSGGLMRRWNDIPPESHAHLLNDENITQYMRNVLLPLFDQFRGRYEGRSDTISLSRLKSSKVVAPSQIPVQNLNECDKWVIAVLMEYSGVYSCYNLLNIEIRKKYRKIKRWLELLYRKKTEPLPFRILCQLLGRKFLPIGYH